MIETYSEGCFDQRLAADGVAVNITGGIEIQAGERSNMPAYIRIKAKIIDISGSRIVAVQPCPPTLFSSFSLPPWASVI